MSAESGGPSECICDLPFMDEFPDAPHSPLCPLWGGER